MLETQVMIQAGKTVSFLALICYIAEGAVETNETRLYKDLFKNYNKYTHPVIDESRPVAIVFDFQLIRIIDVNAKDQFIKTYAWVNQYWNNPHLTWDPDKYNGIKEIHVQPADIWVPDILLYNNVDDEDRFAGGKYTYKTNVAMKYDGNATWLSPAIFKSICKVDVTYFPFDDQECILKFGSWSFDRSKVDLYAHGGDILNANYVKNGEWKLTILKSQRNKVKYQCCPHEFVDVTVQIRLQRESLDFILKLIIPCSLISSMIFLGFVLPPESGERIGLSITVLLAMTVFQQLSSELMPSYGFPLLGQFYFAIMLEIGASLAVTTLILNFYHRNRRRMPKTMRKVILQWLARLLFPCQKPKDWSEIHRKSTAMRRKCSDLEAKGDLSSNDAASCEEDVFECPKDTSPRRDPHVQTWVVQESGAVHTHAKTNGTTENRSFCNHAVSPKTDCNHNGGIKKSWLKKLKKNGNFRSRDKKVGRTGKKRPSTAQLFKQMTIDSLPIGGNMLEWSEEKFKNQKEWIKAARVLDRLFLIISIIVSIATLLTIFLRAPRFRLYG